jgi:putative CocE/NonD family hydrolase
MSERVRELIIPLEEGRVALAADLMGTATAAAPQPVLVSMYPYHKDDVIGDAFETPRRQMAAAGYASLLVDMRGHGASSGSPAASYDLGGVEGADGAAVVEWAAAQDWCNGAVGMWGVSYGAMMAIATAARRPPHLRAIAAVYGTDDCLADSIAPGGSPYALGRYCWAAHMTAMDLCPPTRQDPDGRWRSLWAQHLDRMRQRPGHAFEWQPHVDDPSFWGPRMADASRIEVPTFLVGGWYDLYADAMVRIFNEVGGDRRLVIGPWLHVAPDRVEDEPFDWVDQMCQWWDRYLVPAPGISHPDDAGGASEPAYFEPTALVYVKGAGRWRAYDAWPPPAESRVLFFGPDGRLVPSMGEISTHVRLDFAEISGQGAGLLDPLGTGLGRPEDQRADDSASLAFDTDVLTAELELSGRPEVDVTVQQSASIDLRLAVKLCDVSPEGGSSLLTSGWRRLGRTGSEENQRIAHIQCVPVAAVIPPGHRLRVSISCSDFPRMWPTPGDGSFSLVLGGPNGPRVTLPVVAEPDKAEDWTDRVPRPARPSPVDWSVSGTAALRHRSEDGGEIVETTIETHNELTTPHGATLWMDEQFRALASALDTKAARVFGDVKFALELADGAKVDIAVESVFTETTAKAKARVVVDGSSIFDETWYSAAGEAPAQTDSSETAP